MERPKTVGFNYRAACEGFFTTVSIHTRPWKRSLSTQLTMEEFLPLCESVSVPRKSLKRCSMSFQPSSSSSICKESIRSAKVVKFPMIVFSRGGWSGWVTFNRLSYADRGENNLKTFAKDDWRCKWPKSGSINNLAVSTEDFHFTILNYALRVIIRLEIDERRKGSSRKESFPDGVKNAKLRWSCAAWWIH